MKAFFSLLFLSIFLLGCTPIAAEDASTQKTMTESTLSTSSELQIEDLVEGTGEAAQKGDTLVVHYTGTLLDGTKFDSSLDRGTPFEFVLGVGSVIRGWDQGLLDMKVGGKRKLTIPAAMAYGDRGVGSIPAGSILLFEVELLEIQ